MNKSLEHKSTNENSGIQMIYHGKVVNIEDKFDSGIIKVRINGLDKSVSDENLPPCYPLLPKYLNIYPKIDERVIIFLHTIKNGPSNANQEKRYWLGPLISQPQKLNFDPFYYTSTANEPDGYVAPIEGVSTLPNANGVYPKKDYIALQGRDNSDIIFKNRELLLRAGKHDLNDNILFNKKNPAYIQIKYGLNNIKKEIVNEVTTRIINIPPTHVFEVVIDENTFASTITVKTNTEIISTLQYTDTTRDGVISQIKNGLSDLQKTYPKWKIVANQPEFDDYPKIFPNNTKEIKETTPRVKITKISDDNGSVINLIANKLNLLSHDGKHNFNITDPEHQISEEEQIRINSESHPIVFGDRLVEFLKLMKSFVSNHVHPYHGKSSVKTEMVNKLLNFPLNEILNDNIRTN